MVFLVQKFIAKNKKKRLYLAQSSVNLYNFRCYGFHKTCLHISMNYSFHLGLRF